MATEADALRRTAFHLLCVHLGDSLHSSSSVTLDGHLVVLSTLARNEILVFAALVVVDSVVTDFIRDLSVS